MAIQISNFWLIAIGALILMGFLLPIGGAQVVNYIINGNASINTTDTLGDVMLRGNIASTILNMTGYSIESVGNLSVENGWLALGVNRALYPLLDPGDLAVGGDARFEKGLSALSEYGSQGIAIFQSNESQLSRRTSITGYFIGENKYLCDDLIGFTSSDLDAFVLFIGATEPEFSAPIDTLINSSCVKLGIGVDNLPDVNPVSYVVTNNPYLFVGDGGIFKVTLTNSTDSSVRFESLNTTSINPFRFTSEMDRPNSINTVVLTDMQGNSDVTGFANFFVNSVAANGSINYGALFASVLALLQGGEYTSLDITLVQEGTNVETTALRISPHTNIIAIEREIDPSSVYYENSSGTFDITSDVADNTILTEVFNENGSVLYIGNQINFTKITFALATEGDESIEPNFYYCNNTNDWQFINETVNDGTSGFTSSGSVKAPNPPNRGVCNKALDGTPFINPNNYTYIAIERTNGNLNTIPIIRTVSIFEQSTNIRIGINQSAGEEGAFIIDNVQQDKPGGPVFGVTGFVGDQKEIYMALQTGLNDSASFVRNSFCSFSTRNVTDEQKDNWTYLLNCEQRVKDMGITGRQDFWSSGKGSSLFAEYDIGTQKLHLYNELGNGGLQGEGSFDYRLDSNDANFVNGSIHNLIPTICQEGFNAGDEVPITNENFETGLGIFKNDPNNILDWIVVSDSRCDSGLCANAIGPDTILMETSYSTLGFNETNISFVYSLQSMVGGSSFTVYINNNTGSGDVPIYTDSGTDLKVPVNILLSEDYSNAALINITVECISTLASRQCFYDTFKVFGTAISNTIQNVSKFNSEICFSDGTRGSDGNCSRGIFYSGCDDITYFYGPTNITGGSGGGIGGSGTSNNIAKFASSTTITNSIMTDDSNKITIGGDLLVNGELNATDIFINNYPWLNKSGDTGTGNFIFEKNVTIGGSGLKIDIYPGKVGGFFDLMVMDPLATFSSQTMGMVGGLYLLNDINNESRVRLLASDNSVAWEMEHTGDNNQLYLRKVQDPEINNTFNIESKVNLSEDLYMNNNTINEVKRINFDNSGDNDQGFAIVTNSTTRRTIITWNLTDAIADGVWP